MLIFKWEKPGARATAGFMGLAFFVALVVIGSGHAPIWHGTVLPSLGDGIVGGVFVAGAVCASFVTWRRHASALTGWMVAAGGLVACQSLVVALLAVAAPPPRGDAVLALLLAVALVGLVAVVVPLWELRRAVHVADDGFGIALAMGLMASCYLLLQVPAAVPPSAGMHVVTGVLVTTHVLAVGLVLRDGRLPALMTALLAAALPVVAASLVVTSVGPAGGAWDLVLHVARAAVGAAWLAVAWNALCEAIEQDRRRVETVRQELTVSAREQRERLHELRSTIAGLVSGSAMLDNPDVAPETRQRLWESVRRELDRMDRMLSGRTASTTEIDLDEALGLILELQRLKGRHVELHGTGDLVRARYDALAEVLNILVDNAATHGGVDHSVVEVVRRDDTVDIRVSDDGRGIPADQRDRIFDWGRRGKDSPGEGIGLHVAQRLMAEDGGSLRLADDRERGSSFVISLPAVRRPLDDLDTLDHLGGGLADLATGDRHAWSH